MFPTVVLMEAKVDLHEGTPLRSAGFANEMHAHFLRGVIGFEGVAGNAGANDVFPRGRPAAVARDDVVQVQILAIQSLAAVLAGAVVTLENVVPGELDLLFGKAVEDDQKDDARDANPERNGVNALGVRFLFGEVLPLVEIVSLKGAVFRAEHHLGVAFEQQRQGAAGGADVYRLPQPVEDQHMLV